MDPYWPYPFRLSPVSDPYWRVYKTFVHIDAPPIGVRRVQSAPGDLSLRGTEETAVAAARESEDDTALGGTEETAVAAAHEAENDN